MKNDRRTHCGMISCGYPCDGDGIPVNELDKHNAVATHRVYSPANGSQFIVCDRCLEKVRPLGLVVTKLEKAKQ